jgi:dTDP-4-amino-4,6-dideoxygalactose transaminase
VELQRYDTENLPKRKWIFDTYSKAFSQYPQFKVPVYETADKISSYHLYLLRINNITEEERDKIIQRISEQEVSVNVHYLPLPMLSFYKNEGYDIANYPVTYRNYACEITLPVYYDLTTEQVDTVIQAVINAVVQK